MSSRVLTVTSTVTCGHVPFGVVALTSAARLAVLGEPVLTRAGLGAVQPGCTAAKQGDVPCALVKEVSGGTAAKLRAGGVPVLLATLAGSTNGTINAVPGALTATLAQPKVVAS